MVRAFTLVALLTLSGAAAPMAVQAAEPAISRPAASEAPATVASTQSPFEIAAVANDQWSRGDRLQAAFWFHVFQIRTLPWAEADPSTQARRASINQSLGQTVNEWLASDVEGWLELAERAIAYEAALPLADIRPDALNEADWRAQIERSRAQYAADLRAVFASFEPGELDSIRRERGLPVGPLFEPGAPLDPTWR